MGRALIRFLFDALYTFAFFVITTATALALAWVVDVAELHGLKGLPLTALRGVEMLLIAVDIMGVICASGVMAWRFIKALGDS